MVGSLTAQELLSDIGATVGHPRDWAKHLFDEYVAPLARALEGNSREQGGCPARILVEQLLRWGLRPQSDRDGADLQGVIRERRGNCVELSLLLVLLAKMRRLRAAAVLVPNHMFVRAGDPQQLINIETSRLGEFPSNDEYVRKDRLTPWQIGNGLYLRDLHDQELVGEIAYKSICLELEEGRPIRIETRRTIREAVRKSRSSVGLYNSLGANYCKRRRYYIAAKALQKAYRIDQDSVAVANNLALALAGQQKLHDAAALLKEIVARNKPNCSRHPHLLCNLGRIHCRLGQYDLAEGVLTTACELHALDPSSIRRELLEPYFICLAYFQRQFEYSAVLARRWAALSPKHEIGLVWAASAYRLAGNQSKVDRNGLTSRLESSYIRMLVDLMYDSCDPEEPLRLYPERFAEISCYLGEYWQVRDLTRARNHWNSCCSRAAADTFEHLRSARNLADSGNSVNSRLPGLSLIHTENS